MSRAVKGIGSIIGLATETHAHRKNKQTTEKQCVVSQRPTDQEQQDLDEGDWVLDEAIGEVPADSRSAGEQDSFEKFSLQDRKVDRADSFSTKPLPYPVILPQRRPQKKSRGFVRAYAPLLGECKGISDTEFDKFVTELQQSSQASPYLRTINIAAMIAGAAPSAIAMAVSFSVQAAALTAMEVQTRHKTNTYLDQANEKLFHPVNLHCMIVTFKPDQANQTFVDVDFDRSNTDFIETLVSKGKQRGKWTISSGTSKSEMSIPTAAALIFPELDKASLQDSHEKPNALKRSNKFISTYLDRRAQAKYAGTYGEGSKLAMPDSMRPDNFASRYSDPNHPANSGSLISLLTGGVVDPVGLRKGVEDKLAKIRTNTVGQQRGGDVSADSLIKAGTGSVKKILQQDVLYLMIAEMPSRDEMERLTRSMR